MTFLAIVLAARWASVLTAPGPVAELPSTTMFQPTLGTQPIGTLFVVNAQQQPALEGLHLTGVYVGSRGGGFATFQTAKGEVAVFSGDEIAPGVTLKQIGRDRVTVLSSGSEKELKLPESDTSATPLPPSQVQRLGGRIRIPAAGEREKQ